MHRIVKTLGTAMVVLVLTVAASAAFAGYGGNPANGMTTDECVARDSYWGPDMRDGWLTLPAAMFYANGEDPNWKFWCKKKVVIDVPDDSLVMEAPLVVKGTGGDFTLETYNPYTANGKCYLADMTTETPCRKVSFDAEKLSGQGPCAITVTGTNVTLRNIKVVGTPGDMSAICVNESNAKVQGVEILNKPKNAVAFAANVIGGEVDWTNNIDVTGSGFAIDFGAGVNGSLSQSRVVPMDLKGRTTDDNGVILPAAGEEILKLKALTPTQLINDASGVDVCLKKGWVSTMKDAKGASVPAIRVEGFVRDSGNASDVTNGVLASKVVRLQIYDKNGFVGYVGPFNQKKAAGMGQTRYSGSNEIGRTGNFRFFLKQDPENVIVLIPEDENHQLGKVSQEISLTNETIGECVGKDLGGGFGGGSSSDGKLRFLSYEDCKAVRGIVNAATDKGWDAPGYDTDGDTIDDDMEDTNFNCRCDPQETCWWMADTDQDGVPDGAHEEQGCQQWNYDDSGIRATSCKSKEEGGFINPNDQTNYDPDGDGVPNALSKDSDSDGRNDGVEDRNDGILTTSGTDPVRGVLFYFGPNVTNSDQPVSFSGVTQTCTLGDYGRTIGVDYQLWKLNYNGTVLASGEKLGAMPDLGKGEDQEKLKEAGQPWYELRVMVCRLASISWMQNFNGKYDRDNNETDAYHSVDSDGDQFCDGDGTKCTTGVKKDGSDATTKGKDACPTIKASTDSTDGCGGAGPCIVGQAFRTASPQYVVHEAKNPDGSDNIYSAPMGLQKDPDTGLPVVFGFKDAKGRPDYNRIVRECGDTDKDGIPDCVEDPYGAPNCVDKDTGLMANSADSDGDTYLDGYIQGSKVTEDVCPTTWKTGMDPTMDKFADDKEAYSCDPRQIYLSRPILACFLDRDADGVRDCDEDLNMDGKDDGATVDIKVVNGQVMLTVDVLAQIETDPLMTDTDKDGLNDHLERTQPVKPLEGVGRVFTNPTKADTDSDGLSDAAEDRNGTKKFELTVRSTGSDMCPQLASINFDTDPTRADSDGDSLDDDIELSGAALVVGPSFLQMITNTDLVRAGIPTISDPMSPDSDGDGLPDGVEYNGRVGYFDSNPCMVNSDGDDITNDANEYVGCSLNKDPTCKGNGTKMKDSAGRPDTSSGVDGDSDGLVDGCEAMLGTNPKLKDSDGDGVEDGQESCGECIYTPRKVCTDSKWLVKYQSNPLLVDTDKDGLGDYQEFTYGTKPGDVDSDGDCIPDGPSNTLDPTTGQQIASAGEDKNANGQLDPGETNAISADTDGEGLPDGNIRGIGEDMNCNGARDKQPDGSWAETDPLLKDSDFDGEDDFTAMTSGGSGFQMANIARATAGAKDGCSLTPTATATPASMISFMGLILALTVLVRRRMQVETPCLRPATESPAGREDGMK